MNLETKPLTQRARSRATTGSEADLISLEQFALKGFATI